MKIEEVNFLPELQELANKLLNEGFKITISFPEIDMKKTYFTAWLNDNPVYIQSDRFEGLKFSTVHKPSRDHGTGYGLTLDINEDLIEQLKNACKTIAPNWARNKSTIVRYKNLEEYLKLNNHSIEVTK